MGKPAAIFDFDGTLTSSHVWTGFQKYYFGHKKKRRLIISSFLLSHSLLWLLSKYKLFNEARCMLMWAEDFSTILKGLSKQEASEAFQWVVDNYILTTLQQDVVDILNKHKRSGHVVIIASGASSELLEILGQKLGVSNVVGTKLEVIDGRYTGRTIKPACFGENKVKLLEEYIGQNGLEIDLPSSFAYADSVFDIPLLKLVGNPVATYPDKNLRQFARHNSWQILP